MSSRFSSYYEKFADSKVVCIDEEIPFEIPSEWEWCRLREVVFPPKYGTSNKSEVKGVMPVLRMGNIQDGETIFDKLVFSNNEDDNQKYRLVCGDLLFNRTNSAELVGKTGIYRGQRPAIYAGYIILLRPICINSDYLNYILGSSYARSYCKEVKTIGVQQCNINADKISNFLIPIAPFSEQARIVQKLEEIANPLSKYQKNEIDKTALNKKLCDKLKKSILQEAIQGKLVPQNPNDEPASVLLQRIKEEKQRLIKEGKLKKKDVVDSVIFKGDDNKYFEKKGKDTVCIDEEIPFEIPGNWAWCKLEEITYSVGGKENQIQSKDIKEEGSIKVVSQGLQLFDGYCDKLSKCIYDLPLVLFGDHTRNVKYIDFPFVIGADGTKLIKAICVNPKYLYYWVLYISGIIRNRGYARHYSLLKAIPFALPPLLEQKRIVEKIEQVFAHLM